MVKGENPSEVMLILEIEKGRNWLLMFALHSNYDEPNSFKLEVIVVILWNSF